MMRYSNRQHDSQGNKKYMQKIIIVIIILLLLFLIFTNSNILNTGNNCQVPLKKFNMLSENDILSSLNSSSSLFNKRRF